MNASLPTPHSLSSDGNSSPVESSESPPSRTTQGQWVAEAVKRFEGPLISYATRMLNGDLERGRDVVQDTFLKLCQADRTKVDGHLAQWLYTVCRNRALDVCRKEQRMTSLGDKPLEAAPEQASDPPDQSQGVPALLAALPPRQQEAVRLKFQGGLSYREISTVMDTTVNNVGVLIHTALKSIREKLGEVTP